MGIGTLLKFLFGNRYAILAIAAHRSSLRVGLLFTLAAGLAREYDGEDLLHEPWHILIPPVASLFLASVLFVVLYISFDTRPAYRARFGPSYRSFLALFWMTAPLAFLYAIPYERFLSPGDAVRANLWTLALVATWRVLLTCRFVSILTLHSPWEIFFPVMLVADAAIQVALGFVPLPIIQFMGGIRLTEAESVVGGTAMLIRLIGIPALLFFLLGSGPVLLRRRLRWELPPPTKQPPATPLLVLAVASILVWFAVLPFTQPEQQNRRYAERELNAGRIPAALTFMSVRSRDAFPPHWDPPPRAGYGEDNLPLSRILEHLPAASEWVRATYLRKFTDTYLGPYARHVVKGADWRRDRDMIALLPEGRDLLERHREAIEYLERYFEDTAPESQPSTRPGGQ